MTDSSQSTDLSSKTWRPKGIWGAVMLPIDEHGEIDFGALAEEVEIMCASTLAGIYTNGTAAEFFNQTEAEFEKITDLVLSRAQTSGKPVQIGVSNSNPRVARDRLRRVQSLGPTGVQVTLPDWWPPSTIENTRFMDGMQEAAGETPLILYNPPHAKRQLSLREVADLRGVAPNMVGIKVKGGDEAWYAERQELLPDFSVFVAGHTVAFGRPLGADGAYSNVACLSPDGAVRYWDLIETDQAAASELEARFLAFLRSYLVPLAQAKGLSDAALDKLMAAAGGWGPMNSRLLWPYSGADGIDVEAIAEVARHELPELFD